MCDDDKPFACCAPGCCVRFTNEDHLTVHKKKHDMVLNLENGSKTNVFVADQTPTPTRFIRNCEEVGLFQDLQNVNPFEETFRKAVEAGKMGVTLHEVDASEVSYSADDTLHTPHIFPHVSDNSSSTTAENRDKRDNNSEVAPVVESNPAISDDAANSMLILRFPDGKLVQLSVLAATAAGATVIQTQKGIEPSVSCEQGLAEQSTLIAGDVADSNNVTLSVASPGMISLAKLKLRESLCRNKRSSTCGTGTAAKVMIPALPPRSVAAQHRRRDQHTAVSVEDDKRQKVLERNRAAAMRCRRKRKSWIAALERRGEHLANSNETLQGEVTALRAEVTQLKALLLAHRDCPVTQAMAAQTEPSKHNLLHVPQRIIRLPSICITQPNVTNPEKPMTVVRTPAGEKPILSQNGAVHVIKPNPNVVKVVSHFRKSPVTNNPEPDIQIVEHVTSKQGIS